MLGLTPKFSDELELGGQKSELSRLKRKVEKSSEKFRKHCFKNPPL
jgi:hypothetical protein